MPVSDPARFTLARPATPESLQAFRLTVTSAVAGGAREVLIDIDTLGVLDAPVISALISLLREVRSRGANVSLVATRSSILDTLRITALDKVFTVVTNAEPVSPPGSRPASRRGFPRRVAAFAGIAILAGLLGRSAASAGSQNPADLVSGIVAHNDLSSYRAHVSVNFQLRSFPYVAQHLDGTTYYKRPNNFEIVFENVPSYAKGFDKLYSDIDDPSSWPGRFDMSLVGQRRVDGHDDLVIRLVQKVRGMIDHEDVAIDPSREHIDAMEWHYYNGGTIAMTQQYQMVSGFDVLASQHATIHIPFVHAAADASYTGYQTNVAIDDAVFTREKHN